MRAKVLDLIKENGKYLFIFRKNGNIIKSEVNTKTVEINGKNYPLKKPFGNITKFQHFCVETKLLDNVQKKENDKIYLACIYPEMKRVTYKTKIGAINFAKKELKEMNNNFIDYSSVEVYECKNVNGTYQKKLIFEER